MQQRNVDEVATMNSPPTFLALLARIRSYWLQCFILELSATVMIAVSVVLSNEIKTSDVPHVRSYSH